MVQNAPGGTDMKRQCGGAEKVGVPAEHTTQDRKRGERLDQRTKIFKQKDSWLVSIIKVFPMDSVAKSKRCEKEKE